MRKSREETARTRERILDAASEGIRANGVAGSGLAGVMKAAGLTHGGFYKHFGSKDRSEEHTSELQSHLNLVCRLLLEKKKKKSVGRQSGFCHRLQYLLLIEDCVLVFVMYCCV